jgi:hypothetical protein
MDLSIIGPPTSLTGIVVTAGVKAGTKLLNVIFNDRWLTNAEQNVVQFYANTPPSATVLDSVLYIFYSSPVSDAPPDVNYVTWNGTTWSAPQGVGGAGETAYTVQTVDATSAVTFDGQACVFFQDINDADLESNPGGNLCFSYPNAGARWQIGSGQIMQGSPSAVVFNSRVYVLYQGINSQQLGYTSASSLGGGGNWTAPAGWPNASVTASPSAVTFTSASGQAYLYAFFPTSAGDLACVSMDTSGTMSSSTPLSAQGTNIACSTTSLVFSAVFDGSMYIFYQQSSGGLWYTCSPDGARGACPCRSDPRGSLAFPPR